MWMSDDVCLSLCVYFERPHRGGTCLLDKHRCKRQRRPVQTRVKEPHPALDLSRSDFYWRIQRLTAPRRHGYLSTEDLRPVRGWKQTHAAEYVLPGVKRRVSKVEP